MKYTIQFELPGLPLTPNSRVHWRERHKQNVSWLEKVHYATLPCRPRQPLKVAKLTLTRMSSVEPDFDNGIAGFKPIVDALVKCGILEDDRMSNIGSPTFLWERAKPKQGGVRVRVEGEVP